MKYIDMQIKRRKRGLLNAGYFITPKNDKREAAEKPLPHFSIMTLNLVLPLTHTSNTPLPHTPWVLRVPVR